MNEPLIDLQSLRGWMDEQRLGRGEIEDVRVLTGGTQNILLRFRREGREYILRRPPMNPRPQSNRIMEREMRLLRALEGTSVPHPALIGACASETVLGAAFYLMEPVDGFNATIALPHRVRSDSSVRHRMGIELIEALATLASVDPQQAGLADLGKIDGFLTRQVSRWRGELDGYSKFAAWSGPAALGDVDSVGRWLDAHCPSQMQAGIIHGDYHIGNVIYDESGSLLAVVDWEMVTLGDPLVDLGRLLMSWPGDEVKPYTMRVENLDGFPRREEMIARYSERSGRDLSDLPWFEVLACYKLGILLEGTHARALEGLADMATGLRLHASAVALFNEARRIVGAH